MLCRAKIPSEPPLGRNRLWIDSSQGCGKRTVCKRDASFTPEHRLLDIDHYIRRMVAERYERLKLDSSFLE
jgi:hypothetical protein